MKTFKLLFTISVFSALAIVACKKKTEDNNPGTTDKCASKNLTLTATITNAIKCKNDGKLVIHAKGSTGISYQLGSGTFKTDSTFANLSPGTYTVTIKDAEGCSKAASFTVLETGSKGALFSQVTPIISFKCAATCHTTGQDGAPKNIFATDCDIVARAQLIKTKAVDGSMGTLDGAEKNKILTWFNAGGGYTD